MIYWIVGIGAVLLLALMTYGAWEMATASVEDEDNDTFYRID